MRIARHRKVHENLGEEPYFCSTIAGGWPARIAGMRESRFTPDIRKKFFTVRMLRHWNRLRRIGDGPSLAALEATWMWL